MKYLRLPIAAIVMLAVGLAGCAASATRNENSPNFSIPKGSRIVLHQEVEILPHSARAYVQHGRLQSLRDIDRFRAHCKFEMKRALPTAQKILPDTFVVLKTRDATDRGTHSGAIMPVALRLASGLSFELFTTTIYLDSPTQKTVASITCQHLEDPVRARYVSIQEMRQALGSVATLELAADTRPAI